MTQKIDLYNLCNSNGFSLQEYPLEGRLLLVLSKSTIFVKNSLDEEKKQALVKKAVAFFLASPDSRRAIFWDGEEKFFHL